MSVCLQVYMALQSLTKLNGLGKERDTFLSPLLWKKLLKTCHLQIACIGGAMISC